MEVQDKYNSEYLLQDYPVRAGTKRVVKITNKNSVMGIQVNGKLLTGTLNATVTPICSLDGVNFVQMPDTTIPVLNSATISYIWSKDANPYQWVGVDIDFKGCTGGTIDILLLNKNTQV